MRLIDPSIGHYDKLSMSRRFARDRLTLDLERDKHQIVFVGDSPNDAPMFGFFPHACGVANVRDFAGRMAAEPAWVAPSRGGAGFVEVAEIILAGRADTAPRPAERSSSPVEAL